jgi:hypothetical protein
MDPNPFEPQGLEMAIIGTIILVIVIKAVFWLATGVFILKNGRMPGLMQKLYLARHPRPAMEVKTQKHEHEHRHIHEEHFYLHTE